MDNLYIALYALILFFPYMCKNIFRNKERRKLVYCVVIFSAILLLVGLRNPVMGRDLPGYFSSYRSLHAMSWEQILMLDTYLNYERGYVFFNKILSTITSGNEQIFLFVCAALATIPVAMIIYEKSCDVVLSTVIYLALPIFLIQYSALRQGIALGICFFSIRFVEKKKLFHFLFCVFAAYCFHSSAIVFVVVYFLYHIQISGLIRLALLFAFPIVFIFRKQLFVSISVLFKNNAVITETNAYTLMIVFILIYIFLTFLFYSKSEDKSINSYMNIFFFACLCQIFSSVYNTAIRVGYYFMIALIFLLPMAVRSIKDAKVAFLFRLTIIICFVLFSFYSIYRTSWAMAHPYYFFWETYS